MLQRIYFLVTAISISLLSACSSLPPQGPRTASSAVVPTDSTRLGKLFGELRKQSRSSYRSAFMLLGGAQAAFTSRLALIEQADRSLDIQYYAIHADQSTAHLLQAVVEAAHRGVRVRVLLDDFHSAGKDAQVMRLAFVPGVEMRMFNPVMGARASPPLRALSTLTDFQRAQQRMHNKLFIADNTLGIAGGRNLGDAYFDGLDSDNFIDLDILAAGAVVPQLSRSFDAYWNDVRAYPVQSLVSLQDLDALRQRSSAEHDVATSTNESNTTPLLPLPNADQKALLALPAMDLLHAPWIWAPAVVLADQPEKIALPVEEISPSPESTGISAPVVQSLDLSNYGGRQTINQRTLQQVLPPLDSQSSVVDGLLALVDMARDKLLIVSPYFVPGTDMKAAFRRATARGVKVRILTNSLASNDAPVAHAGYARHRKELLAMGVQLYEQRSVQPHPSTLRDTAGKISGSSGQSRAMLHTKLMVVDGKLTVVGSMNLDMRSQLHNTEIALLVASRSLSEQARQQINASLAEGAWQVTLDEKDQLVWKAPVDSDWGDRTEEPDASLPLRWLIRLIGPLAPDHLL